MKTELNNIKSHEGVTLVLGGTALESVTAVYISYAPDLAIPGATQAIRDFVEKAMKQGVRRLVLLSGRGEEDAQLCERAVQESGVQRALGREPTDFAEYAHRIASSGVWKRAA